MSIIERLRLSQAGIAGVPEAHTQIAIGRALAGGFSLFAHNPATEGRSSPVTPAHPASLERRSKRSQVSGDSAEPAQRTSLPMMLLN